MPMPQCMLGQRSMIAVRLAAVLPLSHHDHAPGARSACNHVLFALQPPPCGRASRVARTAPAVVAATLLQSQIAMHIVPIKVRHGLQSWKQKKIDGDRVDMSRGRFAFDRQLLSAEARGAVSQAER